MKAGFASRPWLIVPTCAAGHLTFALCSLIEPAILKITPLHTMWLIFGRLTWVALIGASVLALCPMLLQVRSAYVHLYLWPQQFILFLSAASALFASVKGVYPDGYKPSSGVFIFADQCFMIYIMLAHLAAVIRNARLDNARTDAANIH